VSFSVKSTNRLGIIEWQATCNEKKCPWTFRDKSKTRARAEGVKHDRSVHAPERKAAAAAKKAAKAERKAAVKAKRDAKKIATQEAKAKRDARAAAAKERKAEAEKKAEESTPARKTSGLYTKGIPNVKDGQNINGIVYDKKGKPVPRATIERYHQT
jgi:phage protein D